MDPDEFATLQYYLLSTANPPCEFVELHDRMFEAWMKIILEAFEEVGNGFSAHLHDDFMRQDIVGCLCAGSEVVAVFLHSFASIDAKAARTFRYMRDNYPETYFQELKARGICNVMTVQYLAVNPEWRGRRRGIHPTTLMLGLAQRIRDEYEMDAIIGAYRRDRKVHEVVYALGGDCVVSNVMNHCTPCDLIVMNRNKPYQYPSEEIATQVVGLWADRIDTLGLRARGLTRRGR